MNKHNNNNPLLTANSRRLRKNMTREECHLWYDFLKPLAITVYRQKPVCGYIVDFCIPSCRIVIELDGSQHYETEHRLKDIHRDNSLSELGYMILRYTNRDVNEHFDWICQDILNNISKRINIKR